MFSRDDITHTDKSTGLIVAKKVTASKQFVATVENKEAKSYVATVKIDKDSIMVSVKYPEGDPVGVGKDECKRLRDEIISRFEEMIKK